MRLLALVAGVLLFGQACAGPSEPVTLPDPSITTTLPTEAWRPYPNPVQGPDGVWHNDCEVLVGDTSALRCADGFTAES